jgi:XTP/dITP diphosphohydrolase
MNKELVLASNNGGKLQEYREILSPLGYTIYTPKDLSIVSDPEEMGASYRENAFIKAAALRALVPWPVIADDSGLEIAALDGFPGIRSARYAATFGGDYAKTNQSILEKLRDKKDRSASYHCVICLFERPDSKPLYFEGICQGEILLEPKGKGGFGYDPIFHSEEGSYDFGVCGEPKKNTVSHRAKALQKLVTYLAID